MTFGQWLTAQREKAGLTQPQLSERSGLSVSYISALERDEPNAKDGSPRRPRLDKVERLAKALHAPHGEALEAAGYKGSPSPPKTVAELLDRLAELGISHFEFLDDEAIRNATPEDLADVLRAVEVTLAVTLRNRHARAPTNRSIHPTSL